MPTQFEPEGFDGGSPGEPPRDSPRRSSRPEMEEGRRASRTCRHRLGHRRIWTHYLDRASRPSPRAPEGGGAAPGRPKAPAIPIMPGSQRTTRMSSRDGTPYTFQTLPTAEGYTTIVIRGGVNVLTVSPPPVGVIDLSADRIIIWRKMGAKVSTGANGEQIENAGDPMEVYLEGHVVIRQDTNMVSRLR